MTGSLLERMKESGDPLLAKQAAAYERACASLKHNKKGLETILAGAVVELRFLDKDKDYSVITCTSNTRLINVYSALKDADKRKRASTANVGIRTNDSRTVLTYDLVENKYKTVSLRAWQILNMLPMPDDADGVILMDELLRRCLTRR